MEYRHKKFDQLRILSQTMTPPVPHNIENQNERVDTPHSVSRDTGSDENFYNSTFVPRVACTSSPLTKRSNPQRMANNVSRSSQSQQDDSDVALTPKSHHVQRATNSEFSYSTPRSHNRRTVISVDTPTPTPLAPSTPIDAILPKINEQTLRGIYKYHGNMKRQFPKKERTPKDQERRNKNTIACRMSRRVKKLEHVAVEEQYKELSAEYSEIVEATIRASAYLNELMKLSAVGCERDMVAQPGAEMLHHRQQVLEEQASSSSSSTSQQDTHEPLKRKQSYTIAFLTGNDQH